MPRKPKDCGIDKRKRAARQIAELEQRVVGAARQATKPPRAPRPGQGTAGALAIANTHASEPNSAETPQVDASEPKNVETPQVDASEPNSAETPAAEAPALTPERNVSPDPPPTPSEPAAVPVRPTLAGLFPRPPIPMAACVSEGPDGARAALSVPVVAHHAPSDNPFISFVVRYRNDPAGMVQNVLNLTPDPWQAQFLNAIARGERRISVRAGHGVGKSAACAWAIIWHLVTRYPQKVVCTAPTAPQLYDALFTEVKFWINKLPPYISELFDVTSDRVVLKAAPEASFVSARTSSREKPEALAGIHSEHVLLVVDEASAVDEAVFESAAGSMSGHNATTLLIGNPTRSSGLFYKTHHELAPEWRTMHVSCVGSPRVTPDFIKQIQDTYGETSNAFRVRVLGDFPLADDDTLIPAELVDAAMRRDIQPDKDAPIIFGVDPARFGDDAAVLCARQGDVVLWFKAWRGLDLMSLCGQIVNEIDLHKPAEVNVDSIGLGAGLADRLRELEHPIRDVNVSETASLNPKANRLRDDLWMQVRDFLQQRACQLPNEESLRADLVTPKYGFTSSGKLQVESKAEMKKRLRRSPDYADALALTFAGRAALVGGRMTPWRAGKPLLRRVSIC